MHTRCLKRAFFGTVELFPYLLYYLAQAIALLPRGTDIPLCDLAV